MSIKYTKSESGDFQLQTYQLIRRPLSEVFDFFSKAENLEILTPSFLNFKTITPTPIKMAVGTIIEYKIMLRVIPLKWRSRISIWDPPHKFMDIQLKGPYLKWEHLHTFAEHPDGTVVEDTVSYRVLGGFLIEKLFVRPDLNKIFTFRHSKLEELFHTN